MKESMIAICCFCCFFTLSSTNAARSYEETSTRRELMPREGRKENELCTMAEMMGYSERTRGIMILKRSLEEWRIVSAEVDDELASKMDPSLMAQLLMAACM